MKIAILGGSFDPPHIGHILISRQVLEFTDVDQVWLMPVYNTSAHHEVFQKKLASAEDRFAMSQLIGDEKIKISDFEVNQNKKSITIDTLKKLSKQYPQHTFYWIVGSDRLETFNLWDNWQEIITDYHLIIFPREHMLWHLEERVKEAFQLQTIPENVTVLQNKELILTNLSSTAIREQVKKGFPIEYLVTPAVEEYIKKNKLYV